MGHLVIDSWEKKHGAFMTSGSACETKCQPRRVVSVQPSLHAPVKRAVQREGLSGDEAINGDCFTAAGHTATDICTALSGILVFQPMLSYLVPSAWLGALPWPSLNLSLFRVLSELPCVNSSTNESDFQLAHSVVFGERWSWYLPFMLILNPFNGLINEYCTVASWLG